MKYRCEKIDAARQLRWLSIETRSSGAGCDFEEVADGGASRFDGGDEYG